MISIVILAHNEASVIRSCLDELLGDLGPNEIEVIVVCNGCSDETASIAGSYGSRVRVIETSIASKSHALNLGDKAASGFPRLYLDADIRIKGRAVRQIAKTMEEGKYLAAAPAMHMDLSRANWFVRGYYRVWTKLPYTQEGFMGVGAYMLSEAGRRRFDRFPDIIADDGYIRVLFERFERVVGLECVSVVAAPATLRELIKIKTRSRLGLYQLRREFPALFAREAATKRYNAAFREIMKCPWRWPYVLSYLWVNLVSRHRARQQMARIGQYIWERDESSRAAAHCRTDQDYRGSNGGDCSDG